MAVYQAEIESKMALIQKNINTIIGSDHGINVFIGNEFDNHFVIGRSGATIYPEKVQM
ncbi:Efa1/LifA-like protein [Escherichia coli]|uniref:Efa1/LifA-like protein n=1 Tax=Escherichia coli TaxID=562 RepID=A0A2X3K042_ECOLX|nr:Efa1/LifA-like protein [Escherichia coli]